MKLSGFLDGEKNRQNAFQSHATIDDEMNRNSIRIMQFIKLVQHRVHEEKSQSCHNSRIFYDPSENYRKLSPLLNANNVGETEEPENFQAWFNCCQKF